jgi:hypothetical protein
MSDPKKPETAPKKGSAIAGVERLIATKYPGGKYPVGYTPQTRTR